MGNTHRRSGGRMRSESFPERLNTKFEKLSLSENGLPFPASFGLPSAAKGDPRDRAGGERGSVHTRFHIRSGKSRGSSHLIRTFCCDLLMCTEGCSEFRWPKSGAKSCSFGLQLLLLLGTRPGGMQCKCFLWARDNSCVLL